MTTVCVRRHHGLSAKKARAAAERVAAELAEEFGFRYGWDGNALHFERTGVTGTITVDKKEVEVMATLGFLLAMLKPRIETEIHRFCDENFGPKSG